MNEPGQLDYIALNAQLNVLGPDGQYQLEQDKKAVRQYFLTNINQNTVFYHNLKEKLDTFVEDGKYEADFLAKYSHDFIKSVFKFVYGKKFRFKSYMGALKFYTGYAMKNNEGTRYLERYEDRIAATALYLAQGDETLAMDFAQVMIDQEYQPATPTYLNSGKAQRGELVSCFLLRIEDSMNSIARAFTSALELSKRGGGVAFSLSNIRETGAPIKGMYGRARGPIPIMKIFEDCFSYADQLGARQGAGAVWISCHHMDLISVLDTKRENADEKVRIKSLSVGVILTDAFWRAYRDGKDYYQFSTYDIKKVYDIAMSDFDINARYQELVDNPRIGKKRISAEEVMQAITPLQGESGYPYTLNDGPANEANPLKNLGRINMSNLCSEILQVNEGSVLNEDNSYEVVGRDISCNLGSANVYNMMFAKNPMHTVSTAMRMLSAVSDMSNISCTPSIVRANREIRSVGLGQMNLASAFAAFGMEYGSEASVQFTDLYFSLIDFYSLRASVDMSMEKGGDGFKGWEGSEYGTGVYFDKMLARRPVVTNSTVKRLFEQSNWVIPTEEDFEKLRQDCMAFGPYNGYRLAVAPTGSISYINNSSSSLHPSAARIEARKEGKTGRVYYPAPLMTNENRDLFTDAYVTGPYKMIDVYAAATRHTDQGLSCTIFIPADTTTDELGHILAYARAKGLKTTYYVRVRQDTIEGTEDEGCASCAV